MHGDYVTRVAHLKRITNETQFQSLMCGCPVRITSPETRRPLKHMKGEDDMESIVSRLTRQKAELENDYYEKGLQEGLQWAKSASYLELDSASKLVLTDENGHYELRKLFRHEVLGDYFSTSISSDVAMAPEEGDDLLNEFATEWLVGWWEAVDRFHSEVMKKL